MTSDFPFTGVGEAGDQLLALTTDEGEMTEREGNETVEIRVRENGPYVVRGPVRLLDADGNEYDISERKTVSLCRCGGSTTKPFCDGTHSRIGFAGAERAVRESEESN